MISKMLAIMNKDLISWKRQPFQFFIAVIPLLIISLFVGVFLQQAEILPAGIILDDNDSIALEIRNQLITIESGTGLKWFAIDGDLSSSEVVEQYEAGSILGYIHIPSNISARINNNETVEITVFIHNINDDVTKNFLQRVELVCNNFNRDLILTNTTYHSVSIEFEASTATDVSFTYYCIGAILALTILLSSGVNMATATASEFEFNTMKELVGGSSTSTIFAGKILSTLLQTSICFIVIMTVEYLVFGFIPKGHPLLLLLLFVWGVLSFSTLGFLFSARMKQTIPAAIAVLILNITGWWIGGGLVPPEVWSGNILKLVGDYWPGTYFFRSFISIAVTGYVDLSLLLFDLLIVGSFGIFMFFVTTKLLVKEMTL